MKTTEKQQIVDALAKISSESALTIIKFQEEIANIQEDVTKMIGTDEEIAIAKAGILGNLAGTALRKSLMKLNSA